MAIQYVNCGYYVVIRKADHTAVYGGTLEECRIWRINNDSSK
jgi:hypothetical protein